MFCHYFLQHSCKSGKATWPGQLTARWAYFVIKAGTQNYESACEIGTRLNENTTNIAERLFNVFTWEQYFSIVRN